MACFGRYLIQMKAQITKQISQGDKSGGISYGCILACFRRYLTHMNAKITSQGDKSGGSHTGAFWLVLDVHMKTKIT